MGLGLVIAVFSLAVFLVFQAQGIFAGDSGDLVTAAALFGVPHPPGYPLYSFLGWLISHIPFLTVSWRITLISSLSHAAVVGIVYATTYSITRHTVASVFASLILFGNYVFFLYSVTPEVFGLFDLFVTLLVYLTVRWIQDFRNTAYILWASLVFGMSLTHHHVIVFLIPALLVATWRKLPKRLTIQAVILVCLGFLPYVYVPIAAGTDSIINWNRAIHWPAFVRLVTRADYGTFVSSGAYGETLFERLLALRAYGTFFITDWTIFGVALLVCGLLALWMKKRQLFWMFFLAIIFLGPVFFFYASFPLVSRFTLGTYERFLLPSYSIISILCGIGFWICIKKLQSIVKIRFAKANSRIVTALVMLVLFLFPGIITSITLWRFLGLPTDKTAENLARDILSSAPQGAIILLSNDTPLFTSQYVRYVLKVRDDTQVIHTSRLPLSDYQQVLKKHFPTLVYPQASVSAYTAEFIKTNHLAGRPVLSNTILPVGDNWFWVPRGLLYEIVEGSSLPTPEAMYKANASVFASFHDPKSGILHRYPHLMLSDVLDVYAFNRIALAKTLIRAHMWQEAKEALLYADSLGGDTSQMEANELLVTVYSYFKECDKAMHSLQKARAASFVPSVSHIKLESMIYGDCLGEDERASELQKEYEMRLKQQEIQLDQL